MLKKLVIVYNPQSSQHGRIEREVLAPARRLEGWLVGKYAIKKTDFETNVRDLTRILKDGDLVIVAGGDGTAAIATNAIMLSGKDVTMGALGYGDFNDMARMLGAKKAVEYGGEYIGGVSEIVAKFEAGKTKEIYPLKVKVNGKHWRFAPCYFGLGMFAESTGVFEEEKVRKKLNTGKKGLGFSIFQLARWYFRHRKGEFVPQGTIEGGARGGKVEEAVIERKEKENAKKGTEDAQDVKAAEIRDDKEAKKAQNRLEAARKREKAREEKERRRMAAREEKCQKEAKIPKSREIVGKMGRGMRQGVGKMGQKMGGMGRKMGEIAGKAMAKADKVIAKAGKVTIELRGRSKARMMDIQVQIQAKRAQMRQRQLEKQEWERMNQPEIRIDTGVDPGTERRRRWSNEGKRSEKASGEEKAKEENE